MPGTALKLAGCLSGVITQPTYRKLFDDDDATGRTGTPRPHSRHRGRNLQ